MLEGMLRFNLVYILSHKLARQFYPRIEITEVVKASSRINPLPNTDTLRYLLNTNNLHMTISVVKQVERKRKLVHSL